jgi:hypothetical protein
MNGDEVEVIVEACQVQQSPATSHQCNQSPVPKAHVNMGICKPPAAIN